VSESRTEAWLEYMPNSVNINNDPIILVMAVSNIIINNNIIRIRDLFTRDKINIIYKFIDELRLYIKEKETIQLSKLPIDKMRPIDNTLSFSNLPVKLLKDNESISYSDVKTPITKTIIKRIIDVGKQSLITMVSV
jgi:hypothetical protein